VIRTPCALTKWGPIAVSVNQASRGTVITAELLPKPRIRVNTIVLNFFLKEIRYRQFLRSSIWPLYRHAIFLRKRVSSKCLWKAISISISNHYYNRCEDVTSAIVLSPSYKMLALINNFQCLFLFSVHEMWRWLGTCQTRYYSIMNVPNFFI